MPRPPAFQSKWSRRSGSRNPTGSACGPHRVRAFTKSSRSCANIECIRAVRERSPGTHIEILVPDFRGRLQRALDVLAQAPPDVMNHNLETVPRLYKQARPGSDYGHSLELLRAFKARFADIATKSGLMVGLGETDEE